MSNTAALFNCGAPPRILFQNNQAGEFIMGIYLGFDVGTSSIKAIAIDAGGTILKTANVPISMETPLPGYFETDAENQWLNGFFRAIKALGAENVSNAKGLCISSVCASFVPIDSGLKPLRNAILYGIDTRAASQIERLNTNLPIDNLVHVCGSGFTSHSILPKILWLKENEPEIYDRTKYFVESSNFISSWLTGEYAWDSPTAAGAHLLNMQKGEYALDLFAQLGIDQHKFPRLRSPLDQLGVVQERASSRTGLPIGIPVSVGACDINAEAFACGSFDPGSLLIVFGSTVSTLYTVDSYKQIPGFLTGPSILPGTYRLGGATSSGGRYLEWLNSTIGFNDREARIDSSRMSDLLMVPFLDGARLPYQNTEYRVLWYGMNSSTTKEDFWRAGAEAIGCEIYDLCQKLSSIASVPATANISGGLASNLSFTRIVSNISGLKLNRFRFVNAAYGDALIALSLQEGLEKTRLILESKRRDVKEVEYIEPDWNLFEAYQKKRTQYFKALKWISELKI